jgi:hypothetical protein
LYTGPKSKIDTRGFEIQHKSNFRETKERKKERRTHFIIGILVDAPQALVHDEAFQILWMALELENLK